MMERDRYNELTEWEIQEIEEDRDKYYDLYIATLNRLRLCKRDHRRNRDRLRAIIEYKDTEMDERWL